MGASGAASGSSTTPARAARQAQVAASQVNSAVSNPNASQTTATATATAVEKPNIYPRTLVASIRPTLGATAPHMDTIKKGMQYVLDAGVEYEEVNGNKSYKGAGTTDKDSRTTAKKPASRSKAALAAVADQQAFSQDPRIHELEDAMSSFLEMQEQLEAERNALEILQNLIAQGQRVPGKDLESSFEILIKNEQKHQQARKKQELKVRPGPPREMVDFRAKVWEVHHGHDPVPTSGAVAGGDDEDDDEMEIVEMGGTSGSDLKCPITTNFLEDPVTSRVCKHSFSRTAILAFIASKRGGVCLCPVHGCNRPITQDALQPNKSLARKVAREIAVQKEMTTLRAEEEDYTMVE